MSHPIKPEPPGKMTSDEFLAWATREDIGRVELVDGDVVAMARETRAHALVKKAVDRAIDDAIAAAKAPCVSYVDGLAVTVDVNNTFVPDVVVDCGDNSDMDSLIADVPTVVVEVLSPSTSSYDRGEKMAAYMRHPALQHYIIVSAQKRYVVHHRRVDDGFHTALLYDGALTLQPPGLVLNLDDFWRGMTGVEPFGAV